MIINLSPGEAVTIFGWALLFSAVIPFLIARKWGGRVVAGVIAVWAAGWSMALAADPDGLSTGEAIGAALAVPTLIWVLGAAVGLAKHRKPQNTH